MKYELVTDGKFWAVKRTESYLTLFPKISYLDLTSLEFWWSKGDRYFKDCWRDKETAEMWLNRFKI